MLCVWGTDASVVVLVLSASYRFAEALVTWIQCNTVAELLRWIPGWRAFLHKKSGVISGQACLFPCICFLHSFSRLYRSWNWQRTRRKRTLWDNPEFLRQLFNDDTKFLASQPANQDGMSFHCLLEDSLLGCLKVLN